MMHFRYLVVLLAILLLLPPTSIVYSDVVVDLYRITYGGSSNASIVLIIRSTEYVDRVEFVYCNKTFNATLLSGDNYNGYWRVTISCSYNTTAYCDCPLVLVYTNTSYYNKSLRRICLVNSTTIGTSSYTLSTSTMVQPPVYTRVSSTYTIATAIPAYPVSTTTVNTEDLMRNIMVVGVIVLVLIIVVTSIGIWVKSKRL